MLSWQDSFLTIGASPEARPLVAAAEPAWVFARDGQRVLWANPAGGAFLGIFRFAALSQRSWAPGHPLRRELDRLARSLPENGSFARLRLTQTLHCVPLDCRCRRLRAGDYRGILVQGLQPTAAGDDVAALAAFLSDEQAAATVTSADSDPRAPSGLAGQALDFPHRGRILRIVLHPVSTDRETLPAESSASPEDPPVDNAGLAIEPELPVAAEAKPASEPPAPKIEPLPNEGPAPHVATDNAGLPIEPEMGGAAATNQSQPGESPSAESREPAQPDALGPIDRVESAGRSVSAGRVARELSREPVRFLWQTDAADRFLFVSPGLAQVVGRNAEIVGERWEDAAGRLRLDPGSRIVRALAHRDTWSGQTAWWPVEGSNVRVPAELTGLPIYGADHSFQGYRGFGVLKPAEALMPTAFDTRFGAADGTAARPAEQVPPYEEAVTASPAVPASGVAAPNVVPIRADMERVADQTRLTPQEFNAFEEIAAALRQRIEDPHAFHRLEGLEQAGAAAAPSKAEPLPDAAGPQPDMRVGKAEGLGGAIGQALASMVVSLFPARTDHAPDRAADEAQTPDIEDRALVAEAEEEGRALEPSDAAPAEPPETASADPIATELPGDAVGDAPVDVDPAATAAPSPLVAAPEVPEVVAGPTRPALPDGESQRRLRELTAILDTATDGVIILDGDGIIESANASAEALFGLEHDELRNMEFGELLTPESAQSALDYLSGLKDNGVASLFNEGREVEARAGSGSIPLFMTLGRISEGDGGRFCAVLRDITHWKRTETELVAARRAAEEASNQKSEFLARVSHEIRTPLNAIIGFAEVMIEERFGPIENERYREYLRDIRTSGEHVVSLVNDLLDISKIEAGKLDVTFAAVPLNELVRECIAMMQPQASRGRVVLRCSVSREVPGIVADQRTMRQIVLNILSNAIKFTGPGGQVIASTSLAETGEAILRIRDTGEGMTEDELARALEPFRQIATATLADRTGTGLGLPLTKALVEANRASLAIRSARGEGTVVTVTFPPTRVLSE
jgi:PAS domain S-box-containing protein